MTDDVFRLPRSSNQYDRLEIDVPALYAKYPLANRARWAAHSHISRRVYRTGIIPLQARFRLWQLMHRLRLDQSWFWTFQQYWRSILQGRPLHTPDDFHFLRGIYRLRHQDNQVPDTTDAAVHVQAWQQPELLYQVFFQVYLESFAPRLRASGWLRRIGAKSFCEYGCATAPVTTAYRTFFDPATLIYLVDLPSIALHYAAFKFAHDPAVEMEALSPAENLLPRPAAKVDAIVCTTVFEHLLDPLSVVQRFVDMLEPRGYLIFDYVRSGGEGLDTRAGAEQRDAVLSFIRDRFDIEDGDTRDLGVDLTLARLKSGAR